MKVSGKTIERYLSPRSNTPSSAKSCAPKPPIAPSSTVISASCSCASRKISSRSKGCEAVQYRRPDLKLGDLPVEVA